MNDSQPDATSSEAPVVRSAGEIREWLVSHIAARLQVDPSQIALDEPLIDVGLDSMEFVAMVGELEQWLGCRFRDNPLIDYPTIDALSEFLAGEVAEGRRVISPGEGGKL
ncbi:MAG TPA: acyl carrier protein [Caulifigura sp.]|nr:acyl carrier protein [Caulifigura sp.]